MIMQNDLSYAACNDVKAICDSTLSKHGIHFFDYARMFDDGSCYLLSNNEKVINYLFDTEAHVFAPIPANLIRDNFLYFIPEDGPYQKVMHDVKSYFNIAHGFDMFEIHPCHVDVCCFAASADNNEVINYYFNNIEFLKNFLHQFKMQASGLISTLNKNRLQLSDKMRLNFSSNARSSYVKKGALSKRQKECMFYLHKGMTIKQISGCLNLSPRTVEHYIETIKIKLNCESRSELFIKSMHLLLDDV